MKHEKNIIQGYGARSYLRLVLNKLNIMTILPLSYIFENLIQIKKLP
jgi:hypothetical protein